MSRGAPTVVRRGAAGASLIEFALVLPLLVALIMGIVSGGTAYNAKLNVTDAVREGARFGATLAVCTGPTACDTATFRTKVRDRVIIASGGDLDTSTVCAELVRVPDTTNACGVTDPAGAPDGSHVVKVSGIRQVDFDVFFFSRRVTLSARTSARYEREPS